ncbi:MAG: 50S ribosomal protein L15 [Phycisphaeraceae bacterium]|nr:50S ribosomal protein L15 [Phycisphaeraceae bacterium]
MMIHEVTPKAGRYRARKRIGRGPGSGHGKTSGRGTKGGGSRSGYSRKRAFEGGQSPLYRRFPKRGFSNFAFRTEYAVVNIGVMDTHFQDGAQITPADLIRVGLIPNDLLPVKVLATGETTKKFNVTAAAFSKAAQEKITKAGGSATVAS